MADAHKLDESYESFKRANIERLADRIGLEYDFNTYKSKIIAERLYREGININNYGEYQAYLNKILISSVAPKEEINTKKEVEIAKNISNKKIDKGFLKKVFSTLMITSVLASSMIIYNKSDFKAKEKYEDYIASIIGVEYNIINDNTEVLSYDDNYYPETTLNYNEIVDDLIKAYKESPDYFDGTMYNAFSNITSVGLDNDDRNNEDKYLLNKYSQMDTIYSYLMDSNNSIERIADCNTFEDYMLKIISETGTLEQSEIAEIKSELAKTYYSDKILKKLANSYNKAMGIKIKEQLKEIETLNEEDSERKI